MTEPSTDPIHTRRDDIHNEIADRLKHFAENVAGVTHALLLTRDALPLVTSGIDRTLAEQWAACFGALASLAENIPGPNGEQDGLSQAIIQRGDALFLAVNSGSSEHFAGHAGTRGGILETVLAVICQPDAQMGAVSYEMGRLVDRFSSYMVEPARAR
ncbi:roadblock/LC7 domain-containing protein [Streptomyces griseorubiginosus]|uniref:roadblock/LC7 domain-containing protein n=1 Tax=Streptomyces griseorubiginosus TaxID=67304 RepID=UPI0036F01D8C